MTSLYGSGSGLIPQGLYSLKNCLLLGRRLRLRKVQLDISEGPQLIDQRKQPRLEKDNSNKEQKKGKNV